MTKRKLGEETPLHSELPPSALSPSPLFSPGLTERQQIALAMKLSGESSVNDPTTTPRPSKVSELLLLLLSVKITALKIVNVSDKQDQQAR